MRLLLTADAVGGVWTYAADLASGLVARGIEVTLAVLGPASPTRPALAGVKVVETGLPLDWTAKLPSQLRTAGRSLARLAAEQDADLVHLNSPALAGDAGFPTPVVGGCHSCLATWWAAVKRGAPPEDFRWRIEATRRGYAACDALIAPSAAFADATARQYGSRPTVVRNGRAARPVLETLKTRAVVAAGRFWDEGKDAATLDALAARLDAPVLALGPCEGPQGQKIVLSHARASGEVAPRRVAAAMGGARGFVSTAVYEPFGLSVLEAAQASCALVLSDIPSLRELWDGAAVFATPRDPDGFAEAARRLLDDEAQAARMGAAACERAGRYGLDAMVEGTLAVYREVLGRSATSMAARA